MIARTLAHIITLASSRRIISLRGIFLQLSLLIILLEDHNLFIDQRLHLIRDKLVPFVLLKQIRRRLPSVVVIIRLLILVLVLLLMAMIVVIVRVLILMIVLLFLVVVVVLVVLVLAIGAAVMMPLLAVVVLVLVAVEAFLDVDFFFQGLRFDPEPLVLLLFDAVGLVQFALLQFPLLLLLLQLLDLVQPILFIVLVVLHDVIIDYID